MQNNKVSAAITANDKQAVLQNVDALQAQLRPLLMFNLSPADRMGMVKMGDKTLSFVGKALTYAGQNPALVPSFLNLEEAGKDFALALDLTEIHSKLSTLLTAVEDTMMVAGSEAYESALIYYNSVKGASRSNIAGTEAIHSDLSAHFPRKRMKQEQPA